MFSMFTTSRANGRPIELYHFKYGDRTIDVATYTDAEFPVVYGGLTYSPIPISRSTATNSGTLDRTSLDIQMPNTLTVPQLWRVYPPGYPVTLTIFQGEAEDGDGQFIAAWVGRVISCSMVDIEATLSCEPISTTFTRSGLRRNYQYMCPHLLYGDKCKADKAAATTTKVVTAVSGRSVTFDSALATGHVGGMVYWEKDDGAFEYRTVVGVSGSTATLTGTTVGLVIGATVSVVMGCLHTLEACRDTHNNAPNFGGYPWIPVKNPIGAVSPYH